MADAQVTLYGLKNYGGEEKVRILNKLNTMSYPRAIDSHYLYNSIKLYNNMLVVLFSIGKWFSNFALVSADFMNNIEFHNVW